MLGIVTLASLQNLNYAMLQRDYTTRAPQQTITQDSTRNYRQVSPLAFRGNAMNINLSSVPYKQEFIMPTANKSEFKTFDEVVAKYEPAMKSVIENFATRAGKQKQFLNWVGLPAAQMKKGETGVSHLDQIYSQAEILKKNADNERPLVVLGIGGSKHTAEFLLNMANVEKGKVIFYSDIDPVSYESFKKELGGDVRNANYLVVSKSGTTFETKDGFTRVENELVKKYMEEGYDEQVAKNMAEKHFAICTDANATDKNLRGQIGSQNGIGNGYIKELFIHDDVGGRYSMFDDSGMFALAYAGVPQETTERILKGAISANEKSINPENVKNNDAAKSAIFNVFSRANGYNMIGQQYYGKIFEGGGENWAKQLYLESLKDFDYTVGKAPDSMHYATEGQFSPNNRDKYNTVMTIMNQDISKNYKRYTNAIAATYSETTPTKLEIIDVEGDKLKPEAIGEYIQTKMLETVYMGMLRREVEAAGSNAKIEQLPEILQPSVETYKNKFKAGSEFELTPGGN